MNEPAFSTNATSGGGATNPVTGGAPGGGHEKRRGYLPEKKTVPEEFSGEDLRQWRDWVEDMEDYLDQITAGMQDFLKSFVRKEEPADSAWRAQVAGQYDVKVLSKENTIDLWRTLKRLTKGEARKIVKSVKDRDGCVAWQKLWERFEQGVEARTGTALTELSELNKKPAKNTRETKSLMTELDSRIKEVEEMGETVSDAHAKSVLIGLLDADTKRHTALAQGSSSYAILRKEVLKFVNYAPGVPEPMQIGRVEHEEWPVWGQEE